MMKKLLVLVAMLSLVVCANAGLIVNQPEAGYGFVETAEGVIDIVALEANPLAIAYVIGSNDGVITLGSIQAAADATSNNGAFGAYTSDAWGFLGSTGNLAAGTVLISGNTFTANEGEATVTLYSVDEVSQAFTALASYTVPEPITVALLGLGGLFVRRK